MEMQGAVVSQQEVLENNKNKKYISDGLGCVELLECFGSDLTVANAARVSFNKEGAFEEVEIDGHMVAKLAARDAKLIKYLAQHRHNSPFFHPQVRMRIKMPIFVAREWWRSTIGFARNEVSRRYITQDPEFFLPPGLRQRDKNLKQGSQEGYVENSTVLLAEMAEHGRHTLALYQKLMADGVAPEQARMVLPQSMYTEFIETASLAGYARVVMLRTDPTAQREIQEYARLVGSLIEKEFPVSWQALMSSPIM